MSKRKSKKTQSQQVKELQSKLEKGIDQIMSENGWGKWLTYQSIFHTYSFANTVLIAQQMPEATRVAGFHTWKKAKRQVLKGSKSIRVLAPIFFTKMVEDENGEETEESYRRYKAVPVFDVSQTDGDELPEQPFYTVSIHGDEDNGLFEALKGFSESQGCPVSIEPYQFGSSLGFYSPTDHSITVKNGSIARQAHVLAHEVAHSLLHKGDAEADGRNPAHLSRGIKELEAESVAFILCNAWGIDPGVSSFGYIADWSGKETQKELKLSAKRIAEASKKVLKSIGTPKNPTLQDSQKAAKKLLKSIGTPKS